MQSSVDGGAIIDATGDAARDSNTPDGTVDAGHDSGAADAALDAQTAVDASTSQLPAPAEDTVEMLLNGVRYTLRQKFSCQSGASGIGFAVSNFDLPTLFLHEVDLDATGTITIGGATGWRMDIDDDSGDAGNAVWGPEGAGCAASVVETSATVFELTANACRIVPQFGGARVGEVSFRVRCTRDDP